MFLPVLFHGVNCTSKSHELQKISETASWEFLVFILSVLKRKIKKSKFFIQIFFLLTHNKNFTLLINDSVSPVRCVAIDSIL